MVDAEQCIEYAHDQPEREPMIRMTVRERDRLLLTIAEMKAEIQMLKARAARLQSEIAATAQQKLYGERETT